MVGGGSQDFGKCTIEVVVDGSAQVEIRGSSGVVRNLAGQGAQWRRFECSAPMPANPANFAFAGVDGRGSQSLVRDPRNGGTAVVQIEDKNGGSEGYTFDITWGNRGGSNQAYPQQGYGQQRGGGYGQRVGRMDRGDERYRPGFRDSAYYRRYNHGFAPEEAVRVCQAEVERQALTRFRRADMHFDATRMDDGPGQQDWVVGTVDVHRPRVTERYRFSCSVDFDSGRVLTATLETAPIADTRGR